MKVSICLSGCDDETKIDHDVTEEQFLFLQDLEEKVNEASTYGCMPTLIIEKIENESNNRR